MDRRYGNLADDLAEDNIEHAVIAAYTGALKGSEEMRRSAFNAALKVYRIRRSDIFEVIARRRVVQMICFANWHRQE